MKKILLSFVLLAISLLIVGCDENLYGQAIVSAPLSECVNNGGFCIPETQSCESFMKIGEVAGAIPFDYSCTYNPLPSIGSSPVMRTSNKVPMQEATGNAVLNSPTQLGESYKCCKWPSSSSPMLIPIMKLLTNPGDRCLDAGGSCNEDPNLGHPTLCEMSNTFFYNNCNAHIVPCLNDDCGSRSYCYVLDDGTYDSVCDQYFIGGIYGTVDTKICNSGGWICSELDQCASCAESTQPYSVQRCSINSGQGECDTGYLKINLTAQTYQESAPEAWNGGQYTTDIVNYNGYLCCGVYGKTLTMGTSGETAFMSLSTETTSQKHMGIPTAYSPTQFLTLGVNGGSDRSINCQIKNNFIACDAGYGCLFKLSSESNAHIYPCNYDAPPMDMPVTVCCQVQ